MIDKRNRIYLCCQCARKVVWPKSMQPAKEQPMDKQKCELCGLKCYGTLYDLKGEDSNARL